MVAVSDSFISFYFQYVAIIRRTKGRSWRWVGQLEVCHPEPRLKLPLQNRRLVDVLMDVGCNDVIEPQIHFVFGPMMHISEFYRKLKIR